ncbi:MAG: type I phosphomannose isomerase catalytic subunit [Roseimicrobium sp.]
MSFTQPITFAPLYMPRVWGGRRLAEELGRTGLPDGPIGESWELVDRDDAQSLVTHGAPIGTTLHQLWTEHRAEVFGQTAPDAPRFPLLAKVLDARETLSVQVHPPADIAPSLQGEPKTEMWYLLDAAANAAVFAGFRHGTDRKLFEQSLANGTVESLLHRLPVQIGDAIFIPSGRCHAIGGGCFIVEIQQNSDTTYRVFDWNRTGLDGKPRALHVPESLASIDFADHEPALATKDTDGTVASCPYFHVEEWQMHAPRADATESGALFTIIQGRVRCGGSEFARGDFFLLPAQAQDRTLSPMSASAIVLRTSLGVAA